MRRPCLQSITKKKYNKLSNRKKNLHGTCGSFAGAFPNISLLNSLSNPSLKTFLSDGAAATMAKKEENSQNIDTHMGRFYLVYNFQH